ncbi:MAG: FAD-dependent oxidoreductase [Prochloraceae cyanobacterium]
MTIEKITTEVLVVGGGTGGTAAAIQAARCGVQTIIVSEFPWLGGMLTSAGVAAPDGNELAAFQTGLWGAYLQALRQKQPGGLDNGWVSMFTYHPSIGAEIFADWVKQLPNLKWISGKTPLAVLRQGNKITGVRFDRLVIEAQITLDATELGDLLALGEVPHRWGWELQQQFNEPSAPVSFNELTDRYRVQVPTWVVILEDYGKSAQAATIPPSSLSPLPFVGAWDNYGAEKFLNYGRLPEGLLMINWPQNGNDYGEGLERIVESEASRQQFLQEAYYHSQNFAHFIQTQLGRRYGLAKNVFPHSLGDGAYALHPYYRESRRLQGQLTVTEKDILPIPGGRVAALPVTAEGKVTSIAVGNYANDHHYPGVEFPLEPKSIRWGGRWTGTPFTIPYSALVPASVEGLLVGEKNISVSHIANGSTRLQPVVMNLGQAAGMAAALCIELNFQPQELAIATLQEALLTDDHAPAAVIPLFNLSPQHPDWLYWQRYYLDNPDAYPADGNCPCSDLPSEHRGTGQYYQGIFHRHDRQEYSITLTEPLDRAGQVWTLVTLEPTVDRQLLDCTQGQLISLLGYCNPSGAWLKVDRL